MRYLPLTDNEKSQMLATIGVKSVDDLYVNIPASVKAKTKINLPNHLGEIEVERKLNSFANQNLPASDSAFFLGAGCYNHHVPASVDYIIQRSEFLTSYTPYQPEIAQGTVQYIFEFQTIIARLTGQEVANASMYDGATSMAEAALMALRIKKDRKKIKLAPKIHPHYVEVLQTYFSNYPEISIEEGEPCEQTACYIVQSPNFFGELQNYDSIRQNCDKSGALMVVVINEILSLGLVNPPSQADIVCGEAQSIGVGMNYGGPHLGFFACKKEYVRTMPGRLCGETIDADGKRSFVLTLSTREQHIRREKATSNICTNQGLMALAFTVHAELLGEIGFKQLAKINHAKACQLFDEITKIKGIKPITKNFFNEFAIELPANINVVELVEKLSKENIIAGYAADSKTLILCATELTKDEDIAKLVEALKVKIK
ncbi:MAG: aminomethyl-transferring glycine dehydrogenase subunit GcvPA [Rickettsiales bacterium]|nr:aminomethyl-transferring glycine dehydrogenase subunit GcvPA [Rickettsiales bacterium]